MERDDILGLLRERILAFAASRLQREAAEDMAQETLLVIHEKYPHVAALDQLVPLAFQILRFKLAASYRKSARHGDSRSILIDDLPLADPAADPETETIRREQRTRLLAALDDLGERCRQILRMKLAGRSFEDIRRHFDVASINTIYTWDLRCRRELIAALNAPPDEDSKEGGAS